MKIYTSYYAKVRKIPEDIVRVSIAGKAPDWYTGLEYKNIAPKIGFFLEWKKNKDNNYYIEHYNTEVLENLNAKRVYLDLERLSNGKDCVLLCYEKPNDFCHRHLVAEWLSHELSIEVSEWSE